MMPRRMTLMEMLGHPIAQDAVQRIAQGIDPRLVAAQAAGNALAGHIAATLGVPKTAAAGDVIDAEYTVIDVTPGVKRKVKVG